MNADQKRGPAFVDLETPEVICELDQLPSWLFRSSFWELVLLSIEIGPAPGLSKMFQRRRKRALLYIACPRLDRDIVRRPEWGEDIWAVALFRGFARMGVPME